MQAKRLDRVNQLLKEEISHLLQRELKDPRLGFVTVTEVEVSKDLRAGKVYVSVLGTEEAWRSSLQALEAFGLLARLEGLIPALESAHAVAYALRLAPTLPRSERVVVGLSGRGDKDVDTVRAHLGGSAT